MKITSLARTASVKSGAEFEAAACGGERQHRLQLRLVDRRFAALQAGNLGGIGIHAGDVVAQIGKARTGYGAHISGSDYSYSHGRQRALNPVESSITSASRRARQTVVDRIQSGVPPCRRFS